MAAMKPRTGDGPLEATKEGRGIVMRVPLEGGGRLVVELTPDEAAALGDELKGVGPHPAACSARRTTLRTSIDLRASARRCAPRRTRRCTAAAPGLAVPTRLRRIGDQGVDRVGQPLSKSAVGRAVVVHQQPGLTVGDDLGDAADVGGHDRGPAGHRLEVDDAERLVDRRADEDRGRGQHCADLAERQHLSIQNTPLRARCSSCTAAVDLGDDLRGVRRAGAQHQLHVRVRTGAPRRAGGRRPSAG